MGDEIVPQHGNVTTHNLENVLYTNVSESTYYKTFLQDGIAHFGELIDVIYEEVRALFVMSIRVSNDDLKYINAFSFRHFHAFQVPQRSLSSFHLFIPAGGQC